MTKSTIVHKFPGHIIPTDFLKLVSGVCSASFGFAGINPDTSQLICEQATGVMPMSELEGLNTVFKDRHLVMYFGDGPAVLPDDAQPYMLVETDPTDTTGETRNPYLAIFMTGDFSKYEGMNGEHNAEFCASDEIIFPKIQRTFEEAQEDKEKFFTLLRGSKVVHKALCNAYDKNGTFLFFPEVGDPISFGDNADRRVYEWGAVSSTHGYVEKPNVVQQTVQAAKTGLSFMRGKMTSTANPVPSPEPQKTAPATPSVPAVPVTPKEEPKAPEGKTKMLVPNGLHGKARNLWLRIFNNGSLPQNHESVKSIFVDNDLVQFAQRVAVEKKEVEDIGRAVHDFKKAGKTAATAAAEATASKAATVLTNKEPEKAAKPITPSRSTVREKAPTAQDYIPVLKDDEVTKAHEQLAKMLDINNQKRPTPLEIQKLESRHKRFSELVGIKQEEMFFLTVKDINDLFDGNHIATAAFIEMRRMVLERGDFKLEDLVNTPKTVEVPAVEPVVEPGKTIDKPEPAKTASGNALNFLRGRQAA